MMPDQNTLFYTFSTMAQVLAAILAATSVFIFAKSSEFRSKMQREMSTLVRELEARVNEGRPEFKDLQVWITQATKAERHGVIPEMKGIFIDRYKAPFVSDSLKEACRVGLFNFGLNNLMFKRFAFLAYFGLLLIAVDLFALGFTSECNIELFRPLATYALLIIILLAISFLIFMGWIIHTTTVEKSVDSAYEPPMN